MRGLIRFLTCLSSLTAETRKGSSSRPMERSSSLGHSDGSECNPARNSVGQASRIRRRGYSFSRPGSCRLLPARPRRHRRTRRRMWLRICPIRRPTTSPALTPLVLLSRAPRSHGGRLSPWSVPGLKMESPPTPTGRPIPPRRTATSSSIGRSRPMRSESRITRSGHSTQSAPSRRPCKRRLAPRCLRSWRARPVPRTWMCSRLSTTSARPTCAMWSHGPRQSWIS
jgi:hypothetical protein